MSNEDIKNFEKKMAQGFTVAIMATLLITLLSFIALRSVVQSMDTVVYEHAQDLLKLQRLYLLTEKKISHSRAYLISGKSKYLEETEVRRSEFINGLEDLEEDLHHPEMKYYLEEVRKSEDMHHHELRRILALQNGNKKEIPELFEHNLKPLRDILNDKISTLVNLKSKIYEDAKKDARHSAKRAVFWVITGGSTASILGVLLAFLVIKTLRRMTSLIRMIEEESRRSKQLIDSNVAGVVALDFQGNISDVNQAFCYMVGYTREEILSHPDIWKKLTPEEFKEQDKKILESLQARGVSTTYDKIFLHREGHPVYVTVGAGVLDKNRGEYACFVVDRSQQRQSEEEAKVLLKELQDAVKARDLFLLLASHELRTPLTSLKLQSQMFKRSVKKEPGESIDPVQLVKIAEQTDAHVNRLDRLVDDMLDISSLSEGNMKLEKSTYNLSEMVEEVVEQVSALFSSLGIGHPEVEGNRSLTINCDKKRIEKVLRVLITNAAQYGDRRPVKIIMKKVLNTAVLSVQDQGVGISEEDRERIFEKFERAISHNEVSGLGMGLYIAREIVKAHGGRIWVESQKDMGSVFNVELPING